MSLINSSVGVYDGTNDIEVSCDSDIDYKIIGDKDQILRVFNNLIKNAIQAIPKDREGLVKVSVLKEDDAILVSIKDNGNGISKENQDKIFVPNFTTKNSGMGLGLAMVQKIIENMNGEITFQTKLGVGTVFIIRFPLITG